MKEFIEKYLVYILGFLFSGYLIFVIERKLNQVEPDSALILEYSLEKAKMQTEINLLNQKIHSYEVEILKIRNDVDNLTSSQLDSVWATIFR